MRPPHSDYFRARRRRLLGSVCSATGKQRETVREVERMLQSQRVPVAW